MCVCVCVCVGMLPPCCSDGQQAHCLWCCAVYIGELQLVDLSLLHCVLNSIVSSVHQCATSACVRLWPGPSWRICDRRGGGRRYEQENLRGRRRWGEKEGSKSLCVQWLGCSRQHCQHFPQRVAGKQGRAVGEIFWCILYQCWSVCVCVCVCVCMCVCTHVTHSNHLNYFL